MRHRLRAAVVLLPLLALLSACGAPPPEHELEQYAAREEHTQYVATLAGKRFTVFYQPSLDVVNIYADAKYGLPQSPDHVHVFAHSGASKDVYPKLASDIHAARSDFMYAPAFDLNQYPGWLYASPTQLASWTHTFRDAAIAGGADLFAFNEAPINTANSPQMQAQIARMLRYLAEPDGNGKALRGILFLTHKPSMPSNWTSSGDVFWKAVDDTTDAVVAEHYHSHGWVCAQSLDAMGAHFFALRHWLATSGVPAKISIASSKFTVLHSSYYAPGISGWQGADSTKVTLASFQRNLSRAALATRRTPGGFNRVSFAPVRDIHTVPGVHDRIRQLARWHWGAGGKAELGCVDGFAGNCNCN